MSARQTIEKFLEGTPITINGPHPWDPHIYDERVYRRVLSGGSLALGESYMDGWWDTEDLAEFINRILHAHIEEKFPLSFEGLFYFIRARLSNLQSRARAKQVVKTHYDTGNDLYLSFLDSYNQYTCAYFKGTDDLEIAQQKKLELICKKLQLKASDKVLDIGSGWGGFAKYASEHYGCHVTGISISDEQIKYARQFCKGLPVTIVKTDYRDIVGMFDKVVICGMLEHVGYKNYPMLMRIVHRALAKEGLFLLHTIGNSWSVYSAEPWINKYIFPNGMLPSIAQIGRSIENLFVMEDWQNFGADYDRTLMAWFGNFDAAWPTLKEKYGERFYRMWKYYLLSMAGAFRSRRNNQLWQIVLSKGGVPGGYISLR
ncbi:MAG: cyclopropane fatty acyl phospholipid synthase [bacterium]|nr:cyclopropane fatty acyl phospholipid synthase [bacterium]